MKPLRIFMMVALLAVPLFASDAWADFTADTVYTPFARVSANTVNQPIIGFTIPCSDTGASPTPDTLKTVALKSYMERAYSVSLVNLWVETNDTAGWQSSDTHLKTFNTDGMQFVKPDTIVITDFNRVLRDSSVADEDTFYITVDAHTDSVNANDSLYHGLGLEVVIEIGYIHLGLSSAQVNTNQLNNSGYVPGPPIQFSPYKLVFDTQGPPFTMDWTHPYDDCKTDTIDLLDTLCIQADTTAFVGPGDAIKGNITLDLSAFGCSSSFLLKPGGWDSCFVIPDTHITNCIDVDSGHIIYATAEDSAGNETTVELRFNKPIDTCKPNIDSIQFFITYDANGDGIAAIGDTLAIVAWGLSNADFEVDSMVADLRAYYPSLLDSQWLKLDDVSNSNRLFRRKFVLLEQPVEMAADSSENRITVWAWDNACNYDTLQDTLGHQVDLQKPAFVECYYFWHWDIDTFACIGIGDSVKIGADLTGTDDLASVTCDLVEGGIDGPADQALYDDGATNHGDTTASDEVYNLLWEVGEPPIEDGKDTNNTVPPTEDYDYTVLITATDGAGNWDTCRTTPRLDRILDTRRPRWSNQDDPGFYIKQMPGAKLAIFWPTSDTDPANSCNEKDAAFFFVYVDSGLGWETDPIGATSDTEYMPDTNMWISEVLTDGKYYKFKIKQEDDCGNFSDFSKVMGALTDGTPPYVCIAMPDSGLTFGAAFPLKAVADSVSHDVDNVRLYYRFRRDLEGPYPPGPWNTCGGYMDRPGSGYVFTDSVHCLEGSGYTGWVEIITEACDIIGNCQDTTMGYDDACLLVEDDLFRAGHFLFYWDTLAPAVMVTEVNGFPSPQTACGYDVWFDSLNWVVIDVDGATAADSFEVEVRGPDSTSLYTIFHEDNLTMPCTIWVSVDGWDEGPQDLYIYVKDYDNNREGDAHVQLCVPPAPPEHCIYISEPVEWQRIRCTGTSGAMCVTITAQKYGYAQCEDVTFTGAVFQWSPTGSVPWYMIDEVIDTVEGGVWTTCWDNTDLVEDGDTIYFRVIAHDEFYMADTSYLVKVFVDCQAPNVTLLMEPLYYTCGNETPKISCDTLLTLKAVVLDDTVDISEVNFYVKKHPDPDIYAYWVLVGQGQPAYYDNIWVFEYDDVDTLDANQYYDFRIGAKDGAGYVMFDYDGDGDFDDSTFNAAVGFDAGITVFLDCEAPQPAISMVADPAASIYNVNPSYLLGGSGKAYVQAGHDITSEISVLPSEDTCEVMKVHWFLSVCDTCWRHVGTSTDPNHYPVTFNPLTDGTLDPYELEDGWWQGNLKAVLYDSLGNSTEDIILLYILDVTPSQAVIVNPLNDSYVYGEVQLSILALNKYQIAKVCYEFKAEGGDWQPINGGYPNACVTQDCVSPTDTTFAHVWHTMNTVDDGVYYLRAVATDCDNNVDDDPPTIQVTVANELPTVTILDPSICFRECPDDPIEIIGFVGGEVLVQATVDSDIPKDRVEFYYKDIFDSVWEYIGEDDSPTDQIYDVLWDTEVDPAEDGRYHVKAGAYNAAGRYKDSEPIEVSVDNTDPRVNIVSINGETHPDGMNVTQYDTLAVQVVAYDDDSDAGATRCYNSGVVSLGFTVDDDQGTSQYNWFTDFHDGDTVFYWNVSGLPSGTYYVKVRAVDCLGNYATHTVTINVTDITPPMVVIGGFYGNYVYGYTDDGDAPDYLKLKLEYRKIEGADTSDWMGIGEPDVVTNTKGCNGREFYRWSWVPSASLEEGVSYQARILSTDDVGNTSEVYAPIVNFTYESGVIVPESDPLGALSFEKNFELGDVHGIVKQTSDEGDEPQMFGLYLPTVGGLEIECVWMQQNLNVSTYFAGSFDAAFIGDGGIGVFFSSVTLAEDGIYPLETGEGQLYTYLKGGDILVVKVDKDLGTWTTYCTEDSVCVWVPGGAVNQDRHLVVWPKEMPPLSLDQPTWIPVGDDNGFATYVGFTTGGNCFDLYAKIRINYSSTLDVPAESLIVAWWNNEQWSTTGLSWGSPYSEGFNTDQHYVEFVAECLQGPFAVIHLLERECEGSIVVKMRESDIEPYCNGYTNSMPTFTALITDNVQGPSAIEQASINFKLDLYESGELITIYDGGSLADDFDASYNTTSGIFKVGWIPGCLADELEEGDHIATVSAQNDNLNWCTRTLNFKVDDTPPDVVWHPSWVSGEKPAVTFAITDELAGVNKDSIWIDIYDADESDQPYEKNLLLTIYPDGVDEFWTNDETLYVELTDPCNGHYMHVVIYDGKYDIEVVEVPLFGWVTERRYDGGVRDCVGNKASAEHLVFPVDRVGPTCDLLTPSYEVPVKIKVVDWLDTLWYTVLDTFPYHQYKPGSGLDVNSIQITENGVEVTSFTYNSATNILTYTPTISGPIAVEVTVMDMMGNEGGIEFNNWDQDADGPEITWTSLTERPIRIRITDAMSGVDWSTLKFYEDGDTVAVDPDTETGVILYTPVAGRIYVEIQVKDNAGNLGTKDFYTEAEFLMFTDPHNYPNPFDAREGRTTIDLGLSKDCYVTVKIYDFAGEFVTTIVSNQYVSTSEKLYWNGSTEGGTDVANGTYLCYIKAKDSDGATKTAVIKITVLKQDK